MVQEISIAQLQEMLESGAHLVDVRESEEKRGDILDLPRSKHWPLSNFGLYKAEISQQYPTVFYCSTGMRSAIAAEMAENWTSQALFSLKGGVVHEVKEKQRQQQDIR